MDGIFRALADPARRKILDLLRRRPRTTGELVERFDDIGRCAVMKHLGILHRAGLVLYRREGRYRINYLNAAPIRRMYERWMIPLAESHSANLLSLKEHVERKSKQKRSK